MHELIKALPLSDPSRRVVILKREDGLYCIAEEYRFRSEYDGEIAAEGWARLSCEGLFGSVEEAENELRATRQLAP